MGTQVLIIDDFRDGADMLRDLLESQGHIVNTAYNGFDGIAAASLTTPKVALVDICMPEMDGYQVARLLRAQFENRVFIVAVSALSDQETKRRCIENGFDLHMAKPVNFPALLNLLASK